MRTWALEQLLQRGPFGVDELSNQRGVSFIQTLTEICHMRLQHIVASRRDSSEATVLVHPLSADCKILLSHLNTCIPDTLTKTVPFAAFLALAHLILVGDQDTFGSAGYLQHANQLCKQSDMHTTLPLIAVCCFHGALLEPVLQRMFDSHCPLDEASPSMSATILIAESAKQAKIEELRGREATPLSVLVSRNDVNGIKTLLKFGTKIVSVCYCQT